MVSPHNGTGICLMTLPNSLLDGGATKLITMVIKKEQIQVGSRVRLREPVEIFNKTYTAGHEFTVYGSSYRGFDLIDDEGNKLDETLFIHDKLELICA